MTLFLFWLEATAAFWSAFLPARDLPAGVTDIREGHAIRARRAEKRRRL